MPRRSQLGALALLTLFALPAGAHAAEWKTLPEITSSATAIGLLDASVAPGGQSASLLWNQGTLRSSERPIGAAFGVPKELAGITPTAIGGALLDDGTTLVAYPDGASIRVAQRARGGEFASPPQDLGVGLAAGLELIALPDGSGLAAFRSADSTAIKVFRRAVGGTGFTAVTGPSIPAGSTITGFILRGAPDGSAILAFATSFAPPVPPPGLPFPQTVVRLHVSTLDTGASQFEAPEAIGSPQSWTPMFLEPSWQLIPTDAVLGADGSIDVAAKRVVTSPMIGTSTTDLLTIRRSPAGTWGGPSILDWANSTSMVGMPTSSLSGVDLVAGSGGATTAAWGTSTTDITMMPASNVKTKRRAAGENDFTSPQTLLSGPIGQPQVGAPQIVAMPGGGALLAATRGAGITVLELSSAGAVINERELANAGGPVLGMQLDVAKGSALLALTKQVDTTHRLQAFAIDQAQVPPTPPVTGGGDQQQTPPDAAPSISFLHLSRKRFATRGKKRGTQLRFNLSEAARVVVGVERSVRGWKAGKVCRATRPKGKAGRKAKRCTVFPRVGTIAAEGKQGENTVTFTGKIGKKTLKAGAYRFSLVATDDAGKRSKPARASFTIARR